MENTKNEKISVEQEEEVTATAASTVTLNATATNDTTEYMLNTKQEYPLIKGARVRVDLKKKKYCVIVPIIKSSNALMGLEIFQVLHSGNYLDSYGAGMRLNLSEKLTKPSQYYEYTDAYGDVYYLSDQYYYVDEGVNAKLTNEELAQLSYDEEAGCFKVGDSLVDYDGETVDGWRLVSSLESAGVKAVVDSMQSAVTAMKAQTNCTEYAGYGVAKYYMRKGNLIKVFNESGKLIQICDYNGNFVYMIYEDPNCISCVIDNKGKKVTFTYDIYSQYLKEIEDHRGRVIEYAIGGEFLYGMSYYTASGTRYDTLSFVNVVDAEENELALVTDGGERATIVYDSQAGDQLNRISWLPQEKSLEFTYDSDDRLVSVKDQDGAEKIYRFTNTGNDAYVDYYRECVHGKVRQAIKYWQGVYNGAYAKEIICAKRSCLSVPTDSFSFVDGSLRYIVYDRRGLILQDTTEGIEVTPTVTKNVEIVNRYDKQHRLIDKGVTETYSTGTVYRYEERYYYNDAEKTDSAGNAYTVYGNVKKKLSWVDGEETTTGFTYVFYTYDESGRFTKTKTVKKKCACTDTCTCRLLEDSDTLSGFVSEQAYDEQGRLVSRKDETGQYTTSYQYVEGTNLLSKTTDPLNVETVYTYDERDRMTKLLCGTSYNTIGYSYDDVAKYGDSTTENYLQFVYDDKKRLSQIKFGDTVYESIEYGENETFNTYTVNRATVTNAKGEKFKFMKDVNGMMDACFYIPVGTEDTSNTSGRVLTLNEYDNYGQLLTIKDGYFPDRFEYDSTGRLIKYSNRDITETYLYTPKGQLAKIEYSGEVNRTVNYGYENNSRGLFLNVKSQGFTTELTYDVYGRLNFRKQRVTGGGVDVQERYLGPINNKEVNTVFWFSNYTLGEMEYYYDDGVNISSIYIDRNLYAEYYYDNLGRLIEEKRYLFGDKVLHEYDKNGNVLKKEYIQYNEQTGEYDFSVVEEFTYNGQYLTSYKGLPCVYDALGNPTTYKGKTLTWTKGKILESYDGLNFVYDGMGRRRKKGDIIYFYGSHGRLLKSTDGMEYFYDESGVMGALYNGVKYIYSKDLQGNIVAIVDETNNLVVKYVYDAWGNHKVLNADGERISADAVHIGNLNPFRYRGYFYDRETGLYYLKSRYYDPETGRFINMDGVEYADTSFLNGLNLYAYCNNNPVMNVDPNGTSWWSQAGKFLADVGNSVADFFVDEVYGNAIKPAYEWVAETAVPAIGDFFSSNFGLGITTEIGGSPNYQLVVESEAGVGVSQSINGNKAVMLVLSKPSEWWKLWDYSLGIDINIDGYGIQVDVGSNTSFGVHMKTNSLAVSLNALGRLGFSVLSHTSEDTYTYFKGSFNLPEISAVVLAVKYIKIFALV